jgi:hypothetical protein
MMIASSYCFQKLQAVDFEIASHLSRRLLHPASLASLAISAIEARDPFI